MYMSRKVIVGAVLLGLAVFLGLGCFGFGEDSLANLLITMGVESDLASQLSRMSFGLCSAVATMLITWGYLDDHEGTPVSSEQLQAVMVSLENEHAERKR